MDEVRVHTKAWAFEMGMLGPSREAGGGFTWDEATYDAHDFPLLCGYTHPDLPVDEFALMSDWYVWLFFFDDHFLETYKRNLDMAGGRAYLARLWDFIPLEPPANAAELPEPRNPVERGLGVLWVQTAPGTSLDWRRRFIANTRDTLETVLWELANISDGRFANPLEYVAMRRTGGGLLWAADLLERANGLELSDAILATRPLRVLQDCYADIVSIHNDLMSYTREVNDEGENANAVLVLEQFLDVEPQRAAYLTADLLSSRTHQFEDTVVSELPILFEERAVPPRERLDVLRYANGLMAWLAGTYEWHAISRRYDDFGEDDAAPGSKPVYVGPTGLGPAATGAFALMGLRSHAPKGADPRPTPKLAAPVGPPTSLGGAPLATVELPPFELPFPAQRHAQTESVAMQSKAWAAKMGLVDGLVWSSAKLDREGVPLLAGHVLPNAEPERLRLICDWLCWAYYVDDLFVVVFKSRGDLIGAKNMAHRLARVVEGGPRPGPSSPAERALAELWQRSNTGLSASARQLLAQRVRAHVESPVWELLNALHDRTPDPIDYFEMRRISGRSELSLSLLELGGVTPVPEAMAGDRALAELRAVFCDVMPLRNDIASYARELGEERELISGLIVLQRFFACTPSEAAGVVQALVASRVEQFQYLVAHALPASADVLALDGAARAALHGHVQALGLWIAGHDLWLTKAGRYRSNPTPTTHFPLGPTGLGTSAARIHELLRRP